jgi:hypothetical protein
MSNQIQVSGDKPEKNKSATFIVIVEGAPLQSVTVAGRHLWVINELSKAGIRGLTEADTGGVVLKEQVYRISKKGIPIRRKWEKHDGAFPGIHRRYWLGCKVIPQKDTEGYA